MSCDSATDMGSAFIHIFDPVQCLQRTINMPTYLFVNNAIKCRYFVFYYIYITKIKYINNIIFTGNVIVLFIFQIFIKTNKIIKIATSHKKNVKKIIKKPSPTLKSCLSVTQVANMLLIASVQKVKIVKSPTRRRGEGTLQNG